MISYTDNLVMWRLYTEYPPPYPCWRPYVNLKLSTAKTITSLWKQHKWAQVLTNNCFTLTPLDTSHQYLLKLGVLQYFQRRWSIPKVLPNACFNKQPCTLISSLAQAPCLSRKSVIHWPVAQIPQFSNPISHNAPFCNRNVHMCAHFCYKMVHYGIFV